MSPDFSVATLFETARSISHQEINELPIRRYEGPVHVVAGHPDLEDAMQDILAERLIGFDTETRPAFKPGESYLPSIAQFATARAVYLFQVQQRELAGAMREILSSENVVKAGVSISDDLRNLKRVFEFDERSVVDLGVVARRHGMKQTGVRNLAGIFLGTRIPKGAKTTNWAARRLTPQQITYAATDAWACRELYLRFEDLKIVE
jgi:ribonuclease D